MKMMSRPMRWTLSLLFGLSCAGSNAGVKPDQMSASGHRAAAAREKESAADDERRYDPGAARVTALAPVDTPGSAPSLPIVISNPTDRYLRDADQHRRHAQQHEAAARALEKFEAAECRDVAVAERAACPLLGPAASISDVPGGVRVQLAAGARVDALVARMRCHYAYARARGFDEAVSCPLYLPGIEIKASRDGKAVDITASSPTEQREVRIRSREEAVFVQGGKP